MRLFDHIQERWTELFESCSLRFAPHVQMKLIPGNITGGAIALTGLYELPQTRRVAELSRSGGMLVDVGAQAGYFTLLWLAGNPENKAIAFEPDPTYFELLQHNISRNGFAARATLLPFAVGARSGAFAFDLDNLCLTIKPVIRSVDVKVVRLDDELASVGRIQFLKIDAEGADTWVLQGAKRLLEQQLIDEIWYEQLTWKMEEFDIPPLESLRFLQSMGYFASPQGKITREMSEFRATRSFGT